MPKLEVLHLRGAQLRHGDALAPPALRELTVDYGHGLDVLRGRFPQLKTLHVQHNELQRHGDFETVATCPVSGNPCQTARGLARGTAGEAAQDLWCSTACGSY